MVTIKILRYISSPFTLVAEATDHVLPLDSGRPILAALVEEEFYPTGDYQSLEAGIGCQGGKIQLCEDTFRQVQKHYPSRLCIIHDASFPQTEAGEAVVSLYTSSLQSSQIKY